MLNIKSAISVSGAIALAAASFAEAKDPVPASVQHANASALRAYSNLLKMFPEGMAAARNLAEMQDKNSKEGKGAFAHDTEADSAVLKVMAAFYKDVTGKDYTEGTDDPRAPLDEIRPALMKLGIFLDFSVAYSPTFSRAEVKLFMLGQEQDPSEVIALVQALELDQGASIVYRKISSVIMGQVGSSDRPSGYARETNSRKYVVIIDENACRLLSAGKKEAAHQLRNKLFIDEVRKIKIEDSSLRQDSAN